MYRLYHFSGLAFLQETAALAFPLLTEPSFPPRAATVSVLRVSPFSSRFFLWP